MRMKRIVTVSLAAAALAACSSNPPPPPAAPAKAPAAPPPVAAPAPEPADAFRKTPPPPGPEVVFVPPKIEEAKLANGIRVLVVERHELPIVAVEVTTVRGADQAAPGVGAFAGAMLAQGTRTRNALQFSDALGKLGASFSSWVGFDGGGVQGQSVTPRFGELLTLLGDAYMNPAFSPAEIARERSRRITRLAEMNDRPASLLSIAQGMTLYPEGHPYSAPLLGTEAALKQVTRAALVKFHAAQFRPELTTIAVAGDITRADAVKEVERVFGAWKGPAGAPPAPAKAEVPAAPPALAAGAPRVVIVDRPGLTQSTVTVTLPGVPRSTEDHDALLVMNTLFGGQFSSRLNLNLREKHAYTYGARSGFEMRHGPGPFSAGGAIVRENTGPAVKEILAEIERIRKEPVTAEELADAKANLIRQLPARFETAGATASTLAGLAIYALPLDEFATRPARLQRITPADVQRVAQKYLVPEQLRVVLVGDAGAVGEQLTALGLGPVTVQKAPGVPAGPPLTGQRGKAAAPAQQAGKAAAPAAPAQQAGKAAAPAGPAQQADKAAAPAAPAQPQAKPPAAKTP
ncbi:peptidase M16 [Sorangium cellulosum]|uniref:Peptidase M16 n=1 Tax=Sorangium cellulosum TaxID=56 RepID=A0A4P2PVL6_SORCE|nr:pitrilysin family protein [Sorangium cellulosum]AUX20787.1 peptidase M16 [Sorangium cellulosum]